MHSANGGSKDGFLTIHHRTDKGRAFSGSNPTVIQEVFGLRQVLHSVLVPFLSLLVKGEKKPLLNLVSKPEEKKHRG